MPKNLKDPVEEARKKPSKTSWVPPQEYKAAYEFFTQRKKELIDSRTNIKGVNLDNKFNEAEKAYLPHKVTVQKPRKINNSQPNPLIKVQTALAIVLNTQFDAVFSPGAERYRSTNEFIKGLTMYSLDPAVSATRQQYFNAAFNTCLMGTGFLRTYRRYQAREVYGPDNKTKTKLIDKDEIDAEALHPKDVWLDDMAIPGDRDSHNDWMWRKVYSFRTFKRKFPESMFPEFAGLLPGGDTSQHLSESSGKTTHKPTRDQIEVYFYENRDDDMFIVEANKVCHFSPLPQQSKQLSLSTGLWLLRSTDTAYGLGLWEIMEQDQQLIDMVRDMSIEQLVLSIFSMIFHDGSNKIDEEKLKVEAGRFYKFLSPEKIQQFKLNGPGLEVIQFIERFYRDIDESTGVGKVLAAESNDKTAFQANLTQEAALRRLKTPANNLKEMYEWELTNRVSMIQQVYPVPKMRHISDVDEMEELQKQLKAGELEADQIYLDDAEKLFMKEYREVPLNVAKQEDGSYSPSDETNFFKIKPGMEKWKGVIRIKLESLLVSSEALEKQNTSELTTIVSPFIVRMALLPATAEYYVPFLLPILNVYNQDPEDWIPKKFMMIYQQSLERIKAEEQQKEMMDKAKASAASTGSDAGRAPVPTPPQAPGTPPSPDGLNPGSQPEINPAQPTPTPPPNVPPAPSFQ